MSGGSAKGRKRERKARANWWEEKEESTPN